MQKLKQKIEERKRAHTNNKRQDVISLREDKALTTVPVPQQIPENVAIEGTRNDLEDSKVREVQHDAKQATVKEKSTFEFKVLGTDNFEKKIKVIIVITLI